MRINDFNRVSLDGMDPCLIEYVFASLRLLYKNDNYLILNYTKEETENHVNERSIVFRFAYYLQVMLNDDSKYADYDLDCEYNRNGSDVKRLMALCNGTYPDVILHKRGNNLNNVMVIETKGYWNKDQRNDEKKLKGFTSLQDHYKYKFGLAILLGRSYEETDIRVFNKGEEVEC